MLSKILSILSPCCLLIGLIAQADASVQLHSASVAGGPLPSANAFYNFDDLTPATNPFGDPDLVLTSEGFGGPDIGVILSPNAQVAQGPPNTSQFAAPFLSGDNGDKFGNDGFGPDGSDQSLGADTTPYLTSGILPGQVTLTFAPSTSFGLLWGSVDSYNYLEFFDADGLSLGVFNGSQIINPANGNQLLGGTAYANFVSDTPIVSVTAWSDPSYAFEFDNVSLTIVPEASTIAVWSILSLVGAGVAYRKSHRK